MSRSFKHKPFQAICGGDSAKKDKVLAHRGVRRVHRLALHNALKSGEYDVLLPHRLECAWNNVYTWSRDGCQSYQGLDSRDWHRHLQANGMVNDMAYSHLWVGDEGYMAWPPAWYKEMMRK